MLVLVMGFQRSIVGTFQRSVVTAFQRSIVGVPQRSVGVKLFEGRRFAFVPRWSGAEQPYEEKEERRKDISEYPAARVTVT